MLRKQSTVYWRSAAGKPRRGAFLFASNRDRKGRVKLENGQVVSVPLGKLFSAAGAPWVERPTGPRIVHNRTTS